MVHHRTQSSFCVSTEVCWLSALAINEQVNLQFRAEASNLLNRVQFALRLSLKGQVTWETWKKIRERQT